MIVAIVVLYNPEINKLEKLLYEVNAQVDKIIVVDNNSSNTISIRFDERNDLQYLRLDKNFGIAHAQNIGIEKALKQSADFIVLLDQDSIPSSSLINKLMDAFSDNNVAASGPYYLDPRNHQSSFFVTEKNGLPYRYTPAEIINRSSLTLDVAFLIASGTMIRASVLKNIGAMRSDYFIDHVDTEWCFRARNAGYQIVGSSAVAIEHSLGDEVKRVWFFGWRQVSYHSPLRDYYMFRNTLLMIKDTQMSFIWKAHFVWRLVQFSVYFLTFAPLRKERLKKMTLGLLHGLKNIRGKLNSITNTCDAIPKTIFDPL